MKSPSKGRSVFAVLWMIFGGLILFVVWLFMDFYNYLYGG